MSNDSCVYCHQKFGGGEDEGIAQYAAFGGLQSPCCGHCFSANDYSIKDSIQLQARSIQRRLKTGGKAFNVDGSEIPSTPESMAAWESIERSF